MDNQYIFQSDWFTAQIPLWEKYLSVFKNKPHLNFLEIGSFEGRSAIWLLENILTDQSSTITCLDTFLGNPEHSEEGIDIRNIEANFDHNIKVSGYGNKVTKLKGYSGKFLRKLPFSKFDFIYIDGSHKASDVLEDAVLSFPLLKKGCILVFDDYIWNVNRNILDKPQIAVDAFLKIYKKQYQLLFKGIQVIIKKI